MNKDEKIIKIMYSINEKTYFNSVEKEECEKYFESKSLLLLASYCYELEELGIFYRENKNNNNCEYLIFLRKISKSIDRDFFKYLSLIENILDKKIIDYLFNYKKFEKIWKVKEWDLANKINFLIDNKLIHKNEKNDMCKISKLRNDVMHNKSVFITGENISEKVKLLKKYLEKFLIGESFSMENIFKKTYKKLDSFKEKDIQKDIKDKIINKVKEVISYE